MRCIEIEDLSEKLTAGNDGSDRYLQVWLCREDPYFTEVAVVVDGKGNGVGVKPMGFRHTVAEAAVRFGWAPVFRLRRPEVASLSEVVDKAPGWWMTDEEED